ncbi:hypothetical protein, partial [Flaviaesturariibacter flavus]
VRTYPLRWEYKSEEDALNNQNGTRSSSDWALLSLDRSGKALREENAANGGPGMATNIASIVLNKVAGRAFQFISKSAFARMATNGKVDPRTVRFSQNSISEKFKGGTSVDDLVVRLKSGEMMNIPPIRIVEKGGKIFTLDNRRLHAFQKAGIEIPYVKLTEIPAKENFKFTTQNNGTSIEVRNSKQSTSQ